MNHRMSAFSLPAVSGPVGGAVQSSSIILEGTILQKEVVSKVVRPTNVEQVVLQISQPATAVDVYIDLRNVPLSPVMFLIVRVYALVGQNRVLVSRGRVNNCDGTSGFQLARQWERARFVSSARAAGQAFEVSIQADNPTVFNPVSDVEFPISAMGYQATGSEPLAQPLHIFPLDISPVLFAYIAHQDCEIITVTGYNGDPAGTAARFIQIWDTTFAMGGAGTGILLEELLVEPQTDFSLSYNEFPLYCQNSFCLAPSSTSGTYTDPSMIGSFSYEVR